MTAKSDVGTLEASGLIGLAAMDPELEYLFRHVLVQDAAYASLLKQERRELHRRVAETLEQLYPDRRGELAGVIGMHFEEAGEAARAAPFLLEAGEHALARFANREARAFFDRAYAGLPTDGAEPEAARSRVRAAIGAARSGWGFGSFDTAIAQLAEVIPLAEAMGEVRLLGEAHYWNAFLRGLRGETSLASPAMARSLEETTRLGIDESSAAMRALQEALLGAGQAFKGELREGARRIEDAFHVLDRSGDPFSLAMLSGFVVIAYARIGDFAAAERTLARADALAERGDPMARLDAQITRAVIELERGDLQLGVALARDCASRSEEIGALRCAVFSNLFAGQGLLQLDRPAEARSLFESTLHHTTVSFQAERNLGLGSVSTAAGRLGDLAGAREGWETALAGARAGGDRFTEAVILRQRGATLGREAGPELERALADLAAALALFEQSDARPAIARTLRDQAVALRLAGRDTEADAAARRSLALAAELGLRDFAADPG